MLSMHSKSTSLQTNEPCIAEDRPFPPTPGDLSTYCVGPLGPGDPELALNFTSWRKVLLLIVISYTIMVSTWGSAVAAPAVAHLMVEFHIGLPVATLSVSLYVLGFAVGPILWGPLSDKIGRRYPLVLGTFGITIFMFAAATAKDVQTVLLSRFFQGAFGASSTAVGPAMAGDVFQTHSRGTALSAVTLSVMAGPMIAPVVGGYIAQSFLGWRWTMYITGIMSALDVVLIVFCLSETHTGSILANRARKIRERTGNWAIQAPGEKDNANYKELAVRLLLKPMKMLASEPILLLVSLYHGFIYGILYLCLEAIPIIWGGYNWPGANVYLPYLALMIGSVAVNILNILSFEPWYNHELKRRNKRLLPENRLPLMILSGGFFAIGIFWMSWTGAYPEHVHWLAPMFGVAVLGFGMVGLFVAAFNYILDTYLMQSGSAFAANTVVRSAFGCAFPLFAHPMFINLGIQWAGTLLGCLATLLFPVPILFYLFGARIRSWSKYAINLDDAPMRAAVKQREDESTAEVQKEEKEQRSRAAPYEA